MEHHRCWALGAGIQNPTEPEPPGRRAQFGVTVDTSVTWYVLLCILTNFVGLAP